MRKYESQNRVCFLWTKTLTSLPLTIASCACPVDSPDLLFDSAVSIAVENVTARVFQAMDDNADDEESLLNKGFGVRLDCAISE